MDLLKSRFTSGRPDLICLFFFGLTLASCGGGTSTVSTPPPPPPVTIKLNQTSVTLSPGAQQQFSATVQGTTNTAVDWSVDGVAGGNATSGTITSAGLYTAPSLAGNHKVVSTSVADTTKTASASVTVQDLISVSPA